MRAIRGPVMSTITKPGQRCREKTESVPSKVKKQQHELAIHKKNRLMIKSLGKWGCTTCVLIYTFAKIYVYIW